MAGPSRAITFAADGQACNSYGECRKWWGRCRTTDSSHTPILFKGVNRTDNPPGYIIALESRFSDAIFMRIAETNNLFTPPDFWACLPNGTIGGECYEYFGYAHIPNYRNVTCHLFDDGGSRMARAVLMVARRSETVVNWSGTIRKWFGECSVN
jgi:hypothetical protein